MTDTLDDLKAKIAKLEDEARAKDGRIRELRIDLDAERTLVTEMRENLEDSRAVFEAWKEAFDMELTADGLWTFKPWMTRAEEIQTAYSELIKKWNKLVPNYNAVIDPRPPGRPLAASDAQRRQVLALRKTGRSLRDIASTTSLGLRTVRTIIDVAQGSDRATKQSAAKIERIPINRNARAAERRRQRTRDGIPKRIGENDKVMSDLLRRAGISAKQ